MHRYPPPFTLCLLQRAFPLDSRTVWVEQQHVKSICLPKENLPLGPGEYNPKPFDRNICTPFVGKRELFASDYKPFNSSVWSADISQGRNGRRLGSKCGSRNALGGVSRSDHVTIFHDNDTRQPLDPKLRFCETVGPTLPHEPLLDSVKYDGRHRAPSLHLDKDKRTRFKDPEPMKEYDPNYNSKHISKRAKQQFVPKVGHQNPFNVEDDFEPHVSKGGPMSEVEKVSWSPKLKRERPNEKLKFDSSCYQRVQVPDILRPSEINRRVKKNTFFKMLTTPIQYNSKNIGTSIDTRRFHGEI